MKPIPSFLIGLIAGALLTAMFIDLSSTRATRACMKDFHSVVASKRELQDSVKKLNEKLLQVHSLNDHARCGIYRYALGHYRAHEVDAFCFQVLSGALNAFPQSIEAEACNQAYIRAAAGIKEKGQ